jgi:HEAT repeat protein
LTVGSLVCLTWQLPCSEHDSLEQQRELARDRYLRVEAELARADLAALTPAQLAARTELLDVLKAYVDRADFGVQSEDPLARIPKFVDSEGRRCAMAELLHATGRDDLVASVRDTNNEAWVVDLAGEEPFLEWLAAHGLALDEAARIQGPSMDGRGIAGGPGGSSSTPAAPRPGAVTPDSPDEPARPRTPSTGGAGPAGPDLTKPITPSSIAVLTEESNDWSAWWEYNKVEFLRPNRLALDRQDDNVTGTFEARHDSLQRTLLPRLVAYLDHPEARVRAAAAGAVGRIGGKDAVAPLTARLSDPAIDVRDMAILGLGSTGAPGAQVLLLEIARNGRGGEVRDFDSRSRALAIVALGLGRRAGFDDTVDTAIAEITAARVLADRTAIGVAAMSYTLLSPTEPMLALAFEMANDSREPTPVRCRAVEALASRRDTEAISALQHLASGSQLELRRSAALALGEIEHPLVPAALMTAHDLEKEPLTRGFLAISLGRCGGAKVRAYLMDTLEHGDGPDRPWAALALGILAHERGDADAARAIRWGLRHESRTPDRGAYWLALGLTRDGESLPILQDALARSADPQSRMYAAQALALLGGEKARDVLRARWNDERSTLVSSQIALALGVLGSNGDESTIGTILATVAEPALQGQVASAMAFHGSYAALGRLAELLGTDGLARASAIDGLGMMLAPVQPLELCASTRSSNYTQFAEWLEEAATTTL